MTENTIQNLDRIMFRAVKQGSDGRSEAAIMHVPNREHRFTFHPGGLLIPGIEVMDTRRVNPRKYDTPSLYIAGDLVGEHEILLDENGQGAVLLGEGLQIPPLTIDMSEGVELAVDASRLTERLNRRTSRSSLDLSSARSPMENSLKSLNGRVRGL